MVDLANAPGAGVIDAPAITRLGDNAAVDASIAAYLNAGERMQTRMDLTWKTCAGLLVLIVIAWAMGLLPVAVRLF
ncbi:MAG: hypothetical protein LC797_23305 [Chloroflexi bacterium]|nr:hypothetical protein [Chloroflexota bacterium]